MTGSLAVCPNCEESLPPGENIFCPNCGLALSDVHLTEATGLSALIKHLEISKLDEKSIQKHQQKWEEEKRRQEEARRSWIGDE